MLSRLELAANSLCSKESLAPFQPKVCGPRGYFDEGPALASVNAQDMPHTNHTDTAHCSGKKTILVILPLYREKPLPCRLAIG